MAPTPRRVLKPSRGHPEALKGRTILVVEDQHLVAEELTEGLRAAGCSVVGPALTLGDALQCADKAFMDCAVLDINLGGEFVWPGSARAASSEDPVRVRHGLFRDY